MRIACMQPFVVAVQVSLKEQKFNAPARDNGFGHNRD